MAAPLSRERIGAPVPGLSSSIASSSRWWICQPRSLREREASGTSTSAIGQLRK